MKRLICIVLGMLVACTLVLGGCGGNENSVEVPTVPASYQYDLSSNEDLRIAADLGGGLLLSLSQDGNVLEEGNDFTYAQNVIVIDADYLADFSAGATLSFQLITTGGSASFTVQILQKETEPEPETKPVLLKDEYEFDLSYPEAVSLSVDLKGQTITGLIMGTTALTDTQYSYSAGVLTVDISCFEGAAAGETLFFTLMTAGGSASFTVNIVKTYTPPSFTDSTTVQFWGYGDEAEVEVFARIVEEFNATVGKENNITVKYTVQPKSSYSSQASIALSSSKTPDVVYVEDSLVKSWAGNEYLAQLDVKNEDGSYMYPGIEEEFLTEGKIWEQGIQRYRYDVESATVTDTAALWALPKDIGPTVIYYNKNYMDQLDITIISVPADQLKAFNAGSYVDGNGKTKAQYGINGTVKEKGYFQLDGKWYFNNRVSMSWDETTDLARAMMEKDLCDYGFFTEWWFSYGWSVGGDCVEYVTDTDGDGYYDFTLNDATYNYIVADGAQPFTVNEHTYQPGQIISYQDKFTAETYNNPDNATQANIRTEIINAKNSGQLNQLPSQLDAFLEFCALTTDTSTVVGTKSDGTTKYGKGKVSMGASSLGSQQAEDLFVSGDIGMFVDGRWETTFLRSESSLAKGSWDVAPLPVYKEYDSNGDITVHGVQAGHSGSVGLAIAEGSKVKAAAWMFLRYVAGEEGQTMQSEKGFCIPNQIALANSEVFLQPDQDPKNSIVFVEAAAYETPGDWWYLKDSDWIDDWANDLYYEVREGTMTVDRLFINNDMATQEMLYEYTYYSPRNRMY